MKVQQQTPLAPAPTDEAAAIWIRFAQTMNECREALATALEAAATSHEAADEFDPETAMRIENAFGHLAQSALILDDLEGDFQ